MPKRKATTELIRGEDPEISIGRESISEHSDTEAPKEKKIFKAVRRLAPTTSSATDTFKSFSGFDWSSKNTENSEKPEKVSSDVLARVRKLNRDFIESIKLYYGENDAADFRPTLKDYIRHFDNIEKDSGFTSGLGGDSVGKATHLTDYFNPVKHTFDPVQMTSDLFGSSAADPKVDSAFPKFDFTASQTHDLFSTANLGVFGTNSLGKTDSTNPLSVFALPNVPKYENPFANLEEEEAEEIPEVVENDLEAAESLFSGKCVLYFFSKEDSKWDKVGVGKVYVRKSEAQSHVFVRADASTGILLLNTMLTSKSMLEMKNPKKISFVSVMGDVPKSTLLSFTEDGDATLFLDAVKSCFEGDL